MDIAENLTQIGTWTRDSFHKDEMRIALFLRLTRKDINNIIDFPFPPEFSPKFKKFCRHYAKLESEFKKGITDHHSWSATMLTWATVLTESAILV